jgi:ADP-heptose:LPS heptosyltransferase
MDVLGLIVEHLPLASTRWLTRSIGRVCCSEQFQRYLFRRETTLLRETGTIRRILVLSDINIGDAVNIQSSIGALRDHFPDVEIDYVYNLAADPLIRGNPQISNTFPIFRGFLRPSGQDRKSVRDLLRSHAYDLVINFCPFLSKRDFGDAGCPVMFPLGLLASIIQATMEKAGRANLVYNITAYVHQRMNGLPETAKEEAEPPACSGVKIYLSRKALAKRDQYVKSLGISSDHLIVFFNPDTSNSYTFINEQLQLDLLTEILLDPNLDFVFLGSGIVFKGIEKELYHQVPGELRKKLILARSLPIDVYASLLDLCDVFVTGDTGPMHIAAARKVCSDGDFSFRNRTAMVSLFGATDSRIYGYDSVREGYIGTNQTAPSRVFEASPSCKNLSCSIQRVTRTCAKGRCFDGLDIRDVAAYVKEYLSSLEK